MREVIMKLVKQIEDQKSGVEYLKKQYDSAKKLLQEDFTEENVSRCESLFKKVGEYEYVLRNLRTALVHLYKTIGVSESEIQNYVFEPEKF